MAESWDRDGTMPERLAATSVGEVGRCRGCAVVFAEQLPRPARRGMSLGGVALLLAACSPVDPERHDATRPQDADGQYDAIGSPVDPERHDAARAQDASEQADAIGSPVDPDRNDATRPQDASGQYDANGSPVDPERSCATPLPIVADGQARVVYGTTVGSPFQSPGANPGPCILYDLELLTPSSLFVAVEGHPEYAEDIDPWQPVLQLARGGCVTPEVLLEQTQNGFHHVEECQERCLTVSCEIDCRTRTLEMAELSLAELEPGRYFLIVAGRPIRGFNVTAGRFTLSVTADVPARCGDGRCTPPFEHFVSCADCPLPGEQPTNSQCQFAVPLALAAGDPPVQLRGRTRLAAQPGPTCAQYFDLSAPPQTELRTTVQALEGYGDCTCFMVAQCSHFPLGTPGWPDWVTSQCVVITPPSGQVMLEVHCDCRDRDGNDLLGLFSLEVGAR